VSSTLRSTCLNAPVLRVGAMTPASASATVTVTEQHVSIISPSLTSLAVACVHHCSRLLLLPGMLRAVQYPRTCACSPAPAVLVTASSLFWYLDSGQVHDASMVLVCSRVL
jgi:hypothetical protein